MEMHGPSSQEERSRRQLALEKVRAAIAAIEALILSDAWDSIPPERQRTLAETVEAMRSDCELLEAVLRSE